MGLKKIIKDFRNNYVIRQVQQMKIPVFESDTVKRYRVVFKGRVQKVGFRLEVLELAKRLDLTGFCQNLENGDVLAELQGEANRIKHLISVMESLKRIKITSKTIEELDVNLAEIGFEKR